MKWFTSDLHLGHRNVVEYCGRPFIDVVDMDIKLVSRWNDVVADGDIVYVLGDFSFQRPADFVETLRQLKGSIVWIFGNHDHKRLAKHAPALKAQGLIHDFGDLLYTKISLEGPNTKATQKIAMCHFPMLVWESSHKGSWHLHGHSHTNLNHANVGVYRHDVGVDNHPDYRPFSETEIIEIMRSKKTLD